MARIAGIAALAGAALVAGCGNGVRVHEHDQVYVARVPNGRVVSLGEGSQPAWSPDGRRIAFAGRSLMVVRADGSGLRALPETATPDIESPPSWSPSSGRIAFTRVVSEDGPVLEMLIDPDGAHPVVLARSAWGTFGDRGPAWSPRGGYLAYAVQGPDRPPSPTNPPSPTASGDLFVRTLSLREGGTYDVAPGSTPIWSPDGTALLVVGDHALQRVSPLGGARMTLATGEIWGAAWSPDTRWIAFTAALQGTLRTHLYVVRPDGTELRSLTGEVGPTAPSWSSTGSIAFASDAGIDTTLADGHDRRTVVHLDHADVDALTWSPDGRSIAFAAAQAHAGD